MTYFDIVGAIAQVSTIAIGSKIRDLRHLVRHYGKGRWRKLKGVARVRIHGGRIRLAEVHWYEAQGVGKKTAQRSNGFSTDMKRRKANPDFLLCVRNKGCDDLQLRKAYLAIPDPVAAAEGFVRVLDESGEDYLYPAECFVPIALPASIAKALAVPA